jgi:hypothetical protein
MEWLGAYLDGELNEARQAWVEEHLTICSACQSELEELRARTGLLHAAPTPRSPRSSQAFAADVLRALDAPARPRPGAGLPRLALYLPLGLFGMWAALQAVVWVSSALLLSMDYLPGLRGGIDGLLFFGRGALGGWTGWLDQALSLLGITVLAEWPGWLAQIPWPAVLILVELVLAALFAVLFTAWLAGLWSVRRAQQRAE